MSRLLVRVPTLSSHLLQEFGFNTCGTFVMPNRPHWSVTDIPTLQIFAFMSIFPDGSILAKLPDVEEIESIAA